MKRRIAEFACVDDLGNQYTILELTEYHSVGLNPNVVEGEELVPGLKEYITDSGKASNRLSDDKFIIFDGFDTIKVRTKK